MTHSRKKSIKKDHDQQKTAQNTNEIVIKNKKKDKRQKKYEEEHFVDINRPVWNYSLLTDEDVSNYQDGTNYCLYEKFV